MKINLNNIGVLLSSLGFLFEVFKGNISAAIYAATCIVLWLRIKQLEK